jgi:heme exporter protein D
MPPENQGYMVAAYVVTAVILVGYAVLLVRRARRALEAASRPEERERVPP